MDQSDSETNPTVVMPNSQPEPEQTIQTLEPTPVLKPQSLVDAATPPNGQIPPTPPDEPQTPQPTPEKPNKKSKKLWVILVAILAVLLAGASAYWFLVRDGKNPSKTAIVKKEIPLLRIANSQGTPSGVYPSGDGYIPDIELAEQTFEGLVHFQEGSKIAPLLATSWSNPDESTWVFTLKTGVKFHTGRTMSAEDVKHSLENFKDNFWYATSGLAITSVKVIDDNHIEIKTDGPDPSLLNKLVVINIMDSKSELKSDVRNGTGPYTSEEEIKDPQTLKELKLVAFDDYHGGKPTVRAINFKYFTTNEEALDAYKKGEVDMVETDTSKEELNAVLRSGDKIIEFSNLVVYYLGFNFNSDESPILNQKVREAIYLATDPAALIAARKASGIPAGQITTVEVPGYNPDITRPERDVAKAKALLKEAGYPDGVTIKLSYYPTSEDAANEIARQLKEAGITLTLDPQGDETYDDVVYGGGAEMFFAGSSASNLDANAVFTSEFRDTPNFSDKDINAAIDDAAKTLDQEKRLAILQKISKDLMDQQRWVPLYTPTSSLIVKNTYVINRDVNGTGLGVYFWKVYETE
ncbi:hypothetical protein A3D14_02580 [Candidatus Saccharibacteria bacterium RIFCSPHIGHO2_02_FULL_47_12]|nr:MAG: hypothetical protein A3D14_02580 [Candidatus Saccharibacteria bacterium RIFCSPHIGHO2_02_FULL_47_12]